MTGNYRIYITIFSLIWVGNVSGQSQIKKLPANINHPGINAYAPFISGDGQTLIYLSDYTDDGHHSMYMATRKSISTWNDGVEVTRLVNRPTLNFRGGFGLNFSGDLLYFTSRKSGLGGFDLWESKRSGNNWLAPSNLGAQINTRAHEGSASISADGKYLYFMRCDQMTEYKGASGCKLMVSKRSGSRWGTPQELPDKINTGNSQNPRILADGKTLIFASNVMGGKGGMDLYLTRKRHDGWSDPVALEFANTEGEDQFASVDAKGRYLLIDRKGDRNWELTQIRIPENFKPLRVMRVSGKVVDEATGEPVNAKLTVFNIADRERLWNENIGNDGTFGIVLNEGASYDISISMKESSYMYFSKVYNLEQMGARDKEQLNIKVEKLYEGQIISSPITFEPRGSKIEDNSTFELRRLAALMRKNPGMRIEVGAYLAGYESDSLQSSEDLTELVVDSLYIERKVEVSLPDSVSLIDSDELDSTNIDSQEIDIDIAPKDSVTYEVIKELKLKYTYHNDRTDLEASAIKQYLVGRGVAEDRIEAEGYIQQSAKPTNEEKAKRWVEIEILEL